MGAWEKLTASPYLSALATPRTGEDFIPGYYSEELDMWVIDSPTGQTPIIEHGAISQLVTKTKVNAEQDDEASYTMELMTKTFIKTESDDECVLQSSNHFLQLVTKTDTKMERDDQTTSNHILQLITKTNVEVERDDNSDSAFGLDTRYYID